MNTRRKEREKRRKKVDLRRTFPLPRRPVDVISAVIRTRCSPAPSPTPHHHLQPLHLRLRLPHQRLPSPTHRFPQLLIRNLQRHDVLSQRSDALEAKSHAGEVRYVGRKNQIRLKRWREEERREESGGRVCVEVGVEKRESHLGGKGEGDEGEHEKTGFCRREAASVAELREARGAEGEREAVYRYEGGGRGVGELDVEDVGRVRKGLRRKGAVFCSDDEGNVRFGKRHCGRCAVDETAAYQRNEAVSAPSPLKESKKGSRRTRCCSKRARFAATRISRTTRPARRLGIGQRRSQRRRRRKRRWRRTLG
jgi:hypothetical protein